MTVGQNKIIAKLQALDEYLGYLKDLQRVNKKSFLNDYHFFGLAEHYLHLSIEVLLDVSKLLIIAYKLPRPEQPRDLFEVLRTHQVINEWLFRSLSGVTGFRNVLVHEYEKVDKALIYANLQENIDQFSEFKKQIKKFLKPKKK